MPNTSGFVAFNQNTIHSSLTTRAFGRKLYILPEVTSTNTHALTLADPLSAHGSVVLAEQQTAGRGRLDRTWFSPPAMNLYASVVLVPTPSFQRMSWIPLIAGLSLTEAIHQTCGLHATLKWPNDVLLHDQKLGGILCEGTSQGPHYQLVAVGIGLNVNMSETDFPDDLRFHSTSLRIHTLTAINRNTLLAHVLNAFETWYTQLTEERLDPIHSAYIAQCETLGRELLVHLSNGEEFFATGQAIGEDGSLHVCLKNAPGAPIRSIHSGDVTHMKIMHS